MTFEIFLNLCVAVLLGATIGIERQVRQRMAGLRTNALVSLGAASFVAFSSLIDGEMSPTRVAAQVVSGIGFIGAGVIMREGVRVRGLNTAATLWCAAAVGLFAGSGNWIGAVVAAGLVLAVNIAIRPLARRIDPKGAMATEVEHHYRVTVRCPEDREAFVRALVLHSFGPTHVHLTSMQSRDLDEPGEVEVGADIVCKGSADEILEQIVGRLSLEPVITAARWHSRLDRPEDGD
ncbi:MAG: MgtC/SapB family protein [Deltaproteobacteria bacterium]|nr:MAG: MgtC/SapB family protein [Deltaproteobacteria bacterium]